MNVLIVCATLFESTPLISHFKKISELSQVQSRYLLGENNIDILITGVGMVPTSFYLGKILVSNNYDLAINMGIAGSFNRSFELGEVLNITEDIFAELGAEDDQKFISLEEMGLDDVSRTKANFESFNNETIKKIKKARSITVNKVHGNANSIKQVEEMYHPDLESMEGASFLFSCTLQNLPCIQIRSVSNYVEKRDKSKWNIPLAIENVNKTVLEIIKSL